MKATFDRKEPKRMKKWINVIKQIWEVLILLLLFICWIEGLGEEEQSKIYVHISKAFEIYSSHILVF
jgi:hypothetical protein